MTREQILHTFVRRLIIGRYEHWVAEYSKLPTNWSVPYTYSNKELSIFPRYNVAFDILTQVEILDSENLPEFTELSRKLENSCAAIGPNTSSVFINDIAQRADEEEREVCEQAILAAISSDLDWVEPLPYRRTLTDTDFADFEELLHQKWGIAPDEPICAKDPKTHPSMAIYDGQSTFDSVIRTFFQGNKIRRVVSMQDAGSRYSKVLDIEHLQPWRDIGGKLIFDDSMNWLIYLSMDDEMVLAGEAVEIQNM